MRCDKSGRCGGKGYIEDWYHYGAQARPMIRQCCDVTAYSRRVQQVTLSREDLFKAIGKEEPFIGHQMNVTHKGIEIKAKPERKEGEPCPVVPIRRK